MQTLTTILRGLGPGDVIDILLVSLVFFIALTLVRQSQSPAATRGFIFVAVFAFSLYLLAQTLRLSATLAIFQNLWVVAALVFLIAFQTELRKALTEFGRTRLFQSFFKQKTTALEEIIVAALRMSEKKIGALIVIERRDPLRSFIDTGTEIDSAISSEMIRTIFAPYTPLHDGAVVIRNNRVAAAGCLLPLSDSPNLPKDLGTRHRAALGVTEDTDAVVIVCSEETGIVSLVHEGRMERNETADSLRQKLRELFEIPEPTDDVEGG